MAQITISGSTGTANGTYSSFTNAGGVFATLNTAGSYNSGNVITISITSDVTTETGANALNFGNWNAITINPVGARMISGSAAAPLIDFNGVDFVKIDGLNSGGNSLTISNSSTAFISNTSTIRFILSASNNVITRCTILGSSTTPLATNGGTIFLSTGSSGGNDGNTVSYCNIGPAGTNLPTKAICGIGSSINKNSFETITNNNIFDFFSATTSISGIYLYLGNDGWTISSNRIYQTAPRIFTSPDLRYTGITIDCFGGTRGSFDITNNIIGFGAPDGTGTTNISGLTNEFRGIDVQNASTAGWTDIGVNTISGIVQTSARNLTNAANNCFIGISLGSPPSGDGLFEVSGNTIGSIDASSSIVINATSATANTAPVVGIADLSLHSNIISGNNIGTITINSGGVGTAVGFSGIFINANIARTTSVNSNSIGGTVPGSIIDNIAGGAMYGIQVSTSNISATGNVIRNLSANCTTASSVAMCGIATANSIGVNTISQNSIYNLNNSAGTAGNFIYGINCSFPSTANIVQRNLIHSFSITSTATDCQLAGIVAVAGSCTYKNNMVSLGIDGNGSSITSGFAINGMFESGGTNSFYYNSIYIGGTGVASSSNTFGFVSSLSTGTRNYINNIFCNARSNASGSGNNYAIGLSGTGFTTDYNDLYATGSGSAVGNFNNFPYTTIADWRTATGQDANAVNVLPSFVSSTDLHLAAYDNCGLDGYGTPIAGITTDYDGQTRDMAAPDMGADEFTAIYSNTLAADNYGITASVTKAIATTGTTYATPVCDLIATVFPSGAHPVSGVIKAAVTRDASNVPLFYNAAPYVTRHYDIEPAVSTSSTTATVTLYFTDQEFVDYNNYNPSWPQLPTSALGDGDPNKANIRITQYHGTPLHSPSQPADYSTGTTDYIDPDDNNITWNGYYWSVSFDISAGFSGFYLYTSYFSSPLPITLNYLRGTRSGSNHILNWQVTCNNTATATMVLERSADGSNFTAINSIVATALRCQQPFDYADVTPLAGINYYRLKMIDANGKISYSNIVTLINATKGLEMMNIAPNPVQGSSFKLNISSAKATPMQVVITDMQGRVVNRQAVSLIAGFNSLNINIGSLAAGTYNVYGTTADDRTKVIRFVKQ